MQSICSWRKCKIQYYNAVHVCIFCLHDLRAPCEDSRVLHPTLFTVRFPHIGP